MLTTQQRPPLPRLVGLGQSGARQRAGAGMSVKWDVILFEIQHDAENAAMLMASLRLCARANRKPKPLCEFCKERPFAAAWPDGDVLCLLCLKCAGENGLLDEPAS